MISTGKCPKCGKTVNHVSIDSIEASAGVMGNKFKAISYVCPNSECKAVLGVQIDPMALKTDCVNEIIEFLKKKR